MTGNRFQFIAGSVPCMKQRWAVIDPMVSLTLHSEHGIRCRSLTWYGSATLVHFKSLASAEIPDLSAPGLHVIEQDLETLSARQYRQKRLTSTFIECCSQSGSLDRTMLSSL